MAEMNFEQLLSRLNEIVTVLEEGKGSLDDSLVAFEEGVQIAQKCNKLLDAAQQKVTALTKCDGEIAEVPFEGDAK